MSDLPLDQVRTLLAVVDEQSFDAAAAVLHVTPSAVSQRIKALEQRTGRVLLLRTKPITLTPSGQVLARFARSLAQLEQDALSELGLDSSTRTLTIAVNADSLATWFLPSLSRLPSSLPIAFDLHREDQDHTATLLREGLVMAAVTASPQPSPGLHISPPGPHALPSNGLPRVHHPLAGPTPRVITPHSPSNHVRPQGRPPGPLLTVPNPPTNFLNGPPPHPVIRVIRGRGSRRPRLGHGPRDPSSLPRRHPGGSRRRSATGRTAALAAVETGFPSPGGRSNGSSRGRKDRTPLSHKPFRRQGCPIGNDRLLGTLNGRGGSSPPRTNSQVSDQQLCAAVEFAFSRIPGQARGGRRPLRSCTLTTRGCLAALSLTTPGSTARAFLGRRASRPSSVALTWTNVRRYAEMAMRSIRLRIRVRNSGL